MSATFVAFVFYCTSAFALADGYYDASWIGGGRTTFAGDYQHPATTSNLAQIVRDANGNLLQFGEAGGPWLGAMQPDGQWLSAFSVPNVPAGTGRLPLDYLILTSSFVAAAIQPDGKYLILTPYYVSRLEPLASALDTDIAFPLPVISNTQGSVQVAITSGAIAAQPDGKVLVAGSGYVSAADTVAKFGVLRLNSNFTLDTTFHGTSPPPPNDVIVFSGGAVIAAAPGETSERVTDVLVQPDGRIILVGAGSLNLELVRLNSDGTLDATFGNGGTAVITWPGHAIESVRRAAPDRAGRIVVAVQGQQLLGVARVTASGQLDGSFGVDGGVARPPFPPQCASLFANAVAIDSAGRIVVVGDCDAPAGSPPPVYFFVARLRGDGYLDSSFGINGYGLGLYAGADTSAFLNNTIVFDTGGHPVVGGESDSHQAGIARLTYDLINTNNFEQAPRGCLPPDCN